MLHLRNGVGLPIVEVRARKGCVSVERVDSENSAVERESWRSWRGDHDLKGAVLSGESVGRLRVRVCSLWGPFVFVVL